MIVDDFFPARLANQRALQQLSQADLGQIAGIASAQISRYESGKNAPRPAIIAKLAKALDIEPAYLASGRSGPSTAVEIRHGIQVPENLFLQLVEISQDRDRDLNDEIIERLKQSFAPATARDQVERRKLELVDSYVSYCRRTSSDVNRAFTKYAEAYAEYMEGADNGIEMVSCIEEVESDYLRELYLTWILERPQRFPKLSDPTSNQSSSAKMAELMLQLTEVAAKIGMAVNISTCRKEDAALFPSQSTTANAEERPSGQVRIGIRKIKKK